MTQSIPCWLATFAVAALITGTPIRSCAAETGPEQGLNTPTEKPAAARSGTTNPGTKRDTYPFRGKVASFDAGTQALKLEGKTNQRVVHLTTQTRLTKLGQPAVAEDLKAGEEVGGTLRKNPEGREEALLIRIGPKPDTGSSSGEPKAKAGKPDAAE